MSEITETIVKTDVTGKVLGISWEGYKATMPIKPIRATGPGEGIREALDRLRERSLTGTGDFSELLTAKLIIDTVYKVTVNGKEYTRTERDYRYIGRSVCEDKQMLNTYGD